jgi:hypothetical protein
MSCIFELNPKKEKINLSHWTWMTREMITWLKYNNGSTPEPSYIQDLSSIFEKEMQRQIITS